MRIKTSLSLTVALSLLLVRSAYGHDIWLTPDRFILSMGDTLTVRQLVGHDLVAEQELPLAKGLTRRFELTTPHGTVDLLRERRGSGNPALRRKIDFDGVALLTMEHAFTRIELSDEKFTEYLEHEELKQVEMLRNKRGRKAVERERYARTIKTLIQVGEAPEAVRYKRITDTDLRYLPGLTNVKALELDGSKVTDAGLAHLGGLTSLRTLNLDGTHVTDVGLVHLKGLRNLRNLDLGGTQVTDVGLAHLKDLTNLRRLFLGGTQVTKRGLLSLKGSAGLSVSLDRTTTHNKMPPMQLLGPKLDIRLMQDPYLLDPGDELEVKILFDGEPLQGKVVWALCGDGRRLVSESKAYTNQLGIARFKLEREGFWLIRLVHMLPCPEPDVDWESYWGSYSFNLD